MKRNRTLIGMILWALAIISLPLSSVLVPHRMAYAAVSVQGGWTVVTPTTGSANPANDSRVVYVSSITGNDANDGLAASRPKRNINGTNGGYALIRDGFPDHLLLERGSTFNETLPNVTKSGRSATEPIVFGTYGPDSSARPLLNVPTSGAGGGSGFTVETARVSNIVLQGWHFKRVSVGAQGISVVKKITNCTFEDLAVENFTFGFLLQGESPTSVNPADLNHCRTVKVRRCVIYDQYSPSGNHSSGMYANSIIDFTVEENVFDRNGWKPNVASSTIFNHNCYTDDGVYTLAGNPGMVFDRNVLMDGSSHGVQVRPGGWVRDNVGIRGAINFQVGSGGLDGGTDMNPIEGLWALVEDNGVVDAKDINASNPRGWGFEFRWLINPRDGGTIIRRNFVTGNTGNYRLAYYFEQVGAGVKNATFTQNVAYNFRGPVYFDCPQNELANITFTNNKLRETTTAVPLIEHLGATANATTYAVRSGNTLYSANASQGAWIDGGGSPSAIDNWGSAAASAGQDLPDPTRTLRTYLISRGIATGSDTDDSAFDKFRVEIRKQRRGNWRTDLTSTSINDYFRTGFGIPTLGGGGAANVAPTANAGTDITATDSDRDGTVSVTLDGSLSSDTDGSIASYAWYRNGQVVATGVRPTITLPLGVQTIDLVVTDNLGLASGPDFMQVTATPGTPVVAAAVGSPGATTVSVGTLTNVNQYLWRWGATSSYGSTRTTSTPSTTIAWPGGTTVHYSVAASAGGVTGAYTTDQTAVAGTDPIASAPVANAGPDQSITDSDGNGVVSVVLDGSGSTDSDGSITAYAWKEGSTTIATGVGPTISAAIGKHTYSLTVTDNATLVSAPDTVVVSLTPGTPTSLVGLGSIGSVTLSCAAMTGVTAYIWEAGNATGTYGTPVVTAQPTLTLGSLSEGTVYWRVSARAGIGGDALTGTASAEQTVVVLGPEGNVPPVANAGPDVNVASVGGLAVEVSLDGTESNDPDPDGSIVSYVWTNTGGGPGPISGSEYVQFLEVGTYTFTLTVTDNEGAVGTDTCVVHVTEEEVDVPDAPASVWLTRLRLGKSLRVKWSPVTGASGYLVMWGTTSGTYTSGVLVPSTTTSATLSNLTNGRRYYVVVKTLAPAGQSLPSTEKNGVPRRVIRDQLLPRRRRHKSVNKGRHHARKTASGGTRIGVA